MGIIDKIQDNIKKQEELQAQRIKKLQAENKIKQAEKNARLDDEIIAILKDISDKLDK